MSRLYAALQRAALFLALSALLIAVIAAGVWFALEQVGLHVPFGVVVVVLGLVMGWIVVTSGSSAPPPAPMSPPRTPLTRTQTEALLVLHREGHVSSAQLRASLGLPPEAISTPPPRSRERR